MSDKARVGGKIGRSGAVCTDIVTNPDFGSSKPYLTGVKGPKYKNRRGSGQRFSGERLRSCGFGPSKVHCDEEVPSMTEREVELLKLVNDNPGITSIPEHLLPSLKTIAVGLKSSKGLIVESRGGYQLMADGRRVAAILFG